MHIWKKIVKINGDVITLYVGNCTRTFENGQFWSAVVGLVLMIDRDRKRVNAKSKKRGHGRCTYNPEKDERLISVLTFLCLQSGREEWPAKGKSKLNAGFGSTFFFPFFPFLFFSFFFLSRIHFTFRQTNFFKLSCSPSLQLSPISPGLLPELLHYTSRRL